MTKVTNKSSKETMRRRIEDLEEQIAQVDAMISSLKDPPFINNIGVRMSPATRLGLWFQRQIGK